MISVTSAAKRFGHKLLFEKLDWTLTPGDRVGIVGGNGTGKSTLLKILLGSESLDSGSRNIGKGISIGYLPQDGAGLGERTVFEECLSVFDSVTQMTEEMESLARQMTDLDHESNEYLTVADRYQRLEHEVRINNGYALEAQAGAVLNGLGFETVDWSRLVSEFSGGWQMRVALAKLLLQKPDLLLLDEPTNHLDLETRNWLESYLQNYPNAFVLISHDRYFLDVTVSKIVEIWNKRVHFYVGGYERYLTQKTERQQQVEAAYKNQREKIEQLETFINRFRYQATKAKQVQSRVKELERIERIEIPAEERTIYFRFPQPSPSGRNVAECRGLSKSYGEKSVFRDVNLVIERGERVALVGPNGAGKSTFIRLLAGDEMPSAGEVRLGHNVEASYFAQDQYRALDPQKRVLDDLGDVSPTSTVTDLRNLLGCFLFSNDDVFKRIDVLSGGERNRYALARMLLQPKNFLLLDEPTNHLDLRAKDVLLSALSEFSGTIVFVSHDRYFIDRLATRVFEIGNGAVNVYPGNYEDYLYRKELEQSVSDGRDHPGNVPEKKAVHQDEVKPRRLNPIRLQQLQARLPEIEEQITQLESGINECETALHTFVSAQETQRQTERLRHQREELEKLMQEWEELSATIEAEC